MANHERLRSKTPPPSAAGAMLIVIGCLFVFLLKYIGIILLMAIPLLFVLFVFYIIDKGVEKMKNKTAYYYDALLEEEECPELMPICDNVWFNSAEEESLNMLFREYLIVKNEWLTSQSHIMHLQKKQDTYSYFKQKSEVESNSVLIQNERERVLLLEKTLGDLMFEQKRCCFFEEDIKIAFSRFSSALPSNAKTVFDDFWGSEPIHALHNYCDHIYFTMHYAVIFEGTNRNLIIIPYKELTISRDHKTEMLLGKMAEDDEFSHLDWFYTKKDGSADLRYKDNRSFCCVYRGVVHFTYKNYSFSLELSNRVKAKEFEESVNRFIALHKTTYEKSIFRMPNGASNGAGAVDSPSYHEAGLNSCVYHELYGNGVVSEIKGEHMTVSFAKDTHTFLLPDAFVRGFLKTVNRAENVSKAHN